MRPLIPRHLGPTQIVTTELMKKTEESCSWRFPLIRNLLASRLAPLVLIIGFGASACGEAQIEAEAPPTLPLVDSTTTTAPPTTDEAPTTTGTPFVITAEMLEGMLETDEGRALIITGIGNEVGLTPDEAECLIDGLPVETLVAATTAFMEGDESGGPFSEEQLREMAPVLAVCEISVESLTR